MAENFITMLPHDKDQRAAHLIFENVEKKGHSTVRIPLIDHTRILTDAPLMKNGLAETRKHKTVFSRRYTIKGGGSNVS